VCYHRAIGESGREYCATQLLKALENVDVEISKNENWLEAKVDTIEKDTKDMSVWEKRREKYGPTGRKPKT
jgi:hypothetical protein